MPKGLPEVGALVQVRSTRWLVEEVVPATAPCRRAPAAPALVHRGLCAQPEGAPRNRRAAVEEGAHRPGRQGRRPARAGKRRARGASPCPTRRLWSRRGGHTPLTALA